MRAIVHHIYKDGFDSIDFKFNHFSNLEALIDQLTQRKMHVVKIEFIKE